MNKENIKKAIAIMERAGTVDMSYWQDVRGDSAIDNEKQLHTCGTSACFAGWVAVSPEFQRDGGQVSSAGAPIFDYLQGSMAIARWLDIRQTLAGELVLGDLDEDDLGYSHFYEKQWEEVDDQDVIKKLKLILSGELS